MRRLVLLVLVACADTRASSPPTSTSPSSADASPSPAPAPTTSASTPASSTTATTATPTATATATASDSCDALVQAARERGPVGLEKSGPKLDPLCEWRVDDAKGFGEATGPGIRSTQGRVDPTTFARTFKAAEKAVRACVKDAPEAKPVLRVRVWFDAQGRATDALADYRVTLPDAVRACVVDVAKKLTLTKPETASSAVYAFDTTTR